MNERYQLKAPGLAGTQTTAAAATERSNAEIAADEAKQAADRADKQEAARLQLEKDVAAEYVGTKLALEPEYLEALRNAGKKVPGAKTPNQVRLEIIAREVARRAGAQPSAKGKAGTAGNPIKIPD
jgi:hypothetical protein